MAGAPADGTGVPWELRLATALPLSAPGAGALIVLVWTLLLFALRMLLGLPVLSRTGPVALAPGAYLDLCVAAVFGYALASARHNRAIIARELARLPRADGTLPAFDPLRIPLRLLRRSRVWAWGGVAAAIPVLAASHRFLVARSGLPWSWAETGVLALPTAVLFWGLGRVAFLSVQDASETLGRAMDGVPVDLRDLRPLDAFGRIALRLALGWILGVSLVALLLILFPGVDTLAATVLPILLASLAVALLTFVLPVARVHRRVLRAKHAALDRIGAELDLVIDETLEPRPGQEGRASDLLALRAHVEGLREWPFDASTLLRFGLYLMIPFGSWVCGALVERLVDLLLE